MSRVIIYNQDVQRLTGKSRNTARILLEKVRKAFDRPKFSPVTLDEFCEYMGLKMETVVRQLKL